MQNLKKKKKKSMADLGCRLLLFNVVPFSTWCNNVLCVAVSKKMDSFLFLSVFFFFFFLFFSFLFKLVSEATSSRLNSCVSSITEKNIDFCTRSAVQPNRINPMHKQCVFIGVYKAAFITWIFKKVLCSWQIYAPIFMDIHIYISVTINVIHMLICMHSN